MMAFILVSMAIILIALALFSKKIRKISAEIERKKCKNSPWYAKQRDVFKYYCPKCNQPFPKSTMNNFKKGSWKSVVMCESCNAKLSVNMQQASLFFAGFFLYFVLLILSKFFSFPLFVNILWMLFCIGLIISSLLMEKLRERKDG